MLRSDLRSYRRAEKWAGRVFFDRGVVDVVGYLRLLGLSIPRHIQDAPGTFRYNRTAFIAPPWKEIYEQDRERKQDFAEAVRTYKTMVTAYADYGYELVEMPCDSIERRMRFVLDESSRSIGT